MVATLAVVLSIWLVVSVPAGIVVGKYFACYNAQFSTLPVEAQDEFWRR